MTNKGHVRVFAVVALVVSCLSLSLFPVMAATRPVVTASNWMCTAGRPLATMAGAKILQAGGNAVDAGVAMMAAISVTEPQMSSLGGDAFIIIFDAKGKKVTTINACGWAPTGATADYYLAQGGIPDRGPLSVEMPGAFSGWILALNRYGTKSLAEVLQPAIELCEKGHVVSYITGKDLNSQGNKDLFAKYPSTQKVWWKDGQPYELGDVVYQKDLAETFKKLVRAEAANKSRGRAAALQAAHDLFYKGEIADKTVKFLNDNGNKLFTKADFADFKAEELKPIVVNYKGIDVYECPPLSQGHVLLQALNILEGYDLKKMGVNSADYLHVMTEALKLGFADREKFVADPRFLPSIPITGMLSKEYAAAQRARIDMDKTAMNWPIEAGPAEKYGNTTFLAAVDKQGNMFGTTTSILSGWGSGMIVDGLGFFLNNRMAYFHMDEGHADQVAPRKRVRQTINPAVALLKGQPYMVWGTPGADQQPQSMLQVFLNVVDFGMTVQDAIEFPKIGIRHFPSSMGPHAYQNDIQVENRIPQDVIDGLKAKGQKVTVVGEWGIGGNNQMIIRNPETGALMGGADPRREGYTIGW